MVKYVIDNGGYLAVSQEYGLSGRGATEEKALASLNRFLEEMKDDQRKEKRTEGRMEKWTKKEKKIYQRRAEARQP